MTIMGFGNTNNLRLGQSLNANLIKQQVEAPKEEVVKEEADKVELQASKTSLEQVKYDQVDSLLIANGIKINKPEQAENNDEKTKITTYSKKSDRLWDRAKKVYQKARDAFFAGDMDKYEKLINRFDKLVAKFQESV